MEIGGLRATCTTPFRRTRNIFAFLLFIILCVSFFINFYFFFRFFFSFFVIDVVVAVAARRPSSHAHHPYYNNMKTSTYRKAFCMWIIFGSNTMRVCVLRSERACKRLREWSCIHFTISINSIDFFSGADGKCFEPRITIRRTQNEWNGKTHTFRCSHNCT